MPYANFGPEKIPEGISADVALMLTDALPTGYQAAQMVDIKEGDTVLIFGAGPVGIFAARSACLMGAGRVIVTDHLDYRLDFVSRYGPVEVINVTHLIDPDRLLQEDHRVPRRGLCDRRRGLRRFGEHLSGADGLRARAAGRQRGCAALGHQFRARAEPCRWSASTGRRCTSCRWGASSTKV